MLTPTYQHWFILLVQRAADLPEHLHNNATTLAAMIDPSSNNPGPDC